MASSPCPTLARATDPQQSGQEGMALRLRAAFVVAGLALGALTVLAPTAAAADCGSTITPNWVFPSQGSTRTYTSFAPLSGAASFLDAPAHCGILDFNVQLDGVDLGRYGTTSESFSEYRIETYPFQLPLAPGQHTLRFELFEVGGAVGVAVTEFEVVATRADLDDYVPDLDLSLAPSPVIGVSTPGADPVTGQPLPSVSTTLYTPGFAVTSSLFIDLLRTAGQDYTLLLHTPFGDVPLACPGCPQPVVADASLLVRVDLVVAGNDLGVDGPVGVDLSGQPAP